MAKRDYNGWENEDLIKRIEGLEKRKKYGLVWDEESTQEEFEEESRGKLPVLIEDKDKGINTDDDGPTHILIEGDNYHALSVLNYTHEGKIDVIYIDPPYNTKQGFTFNDKIVDINDSYRHSKWLSFISKRLELAKKLLRNSGSIFISIDDNEQAHLKLLCDEIYLESNFICNIIWQKRSGPPNDQKIGTTHEYILVYSKNKEKVNLNRKKRSDSMLQRYKNPDNHPKGEWVAGDLMANVKGGRYVKSLYFPIKNPNTNEEHYPSSNGNWRFNKKKIANLLINDEIYFGKDGKGRPKLKRFLCDVKKGIPFKSIWDYLPHNNTATREILELFSSVNIFDTPKPKDLIREVIRASEPEDKKALILDFFAGSGTTGHAVLDLNNEDGGKRQFILCTNNENKIMDEVCYPRVQKVMQGYTNNKGEAIEGLGGNLKYFKTDFVAGENTDSNKALITKRSVEMLCLREGTFEVVEQSDQWQIFKNKEKHTAILFEPEGLGDFRERIELVEGKVSVYVFSLSNDTHAEAFIGLEGKVTLCAVPESILKVYRRIFK